MRRQLGTPSVSGVYCLMKTSTDPVYIGIDLGDRKHQVCVTNQQGEIITEEKIPNDRPALSQLARRFPQAKAFLEVGTHSPWISRYLEQLGWEVTVANARKLRAIYSNDRKCDRLDAQMLARLGRVDPQLLHPVHHGSAAAQQDLLWIKLRDRLVSTRVEIISAVNFSLKSLGHRIGGGSSASYLTRLERDLPPECRPMVEPMMDVLRSLNEQIKRYDQTIARLTREQYPVCQRLMQVGGVGPITALSFVLKLERPERFGKLRDVGPYLGLCPKRDQSGDQDKQLPISKRGDAYLRRLLVSCAHYVLGSFGPDSALRDFGLRISERGGARAKKRAVVAVARKLSVLLLKRWRDPVLYEPYPESPAV